MKLFSCHRCQQLLFFESTCCINCGFTLAYLPDRDLIGAIAPDQDGGGGWRALAPAAEGARYRLCANSVQHGVCNWAIPASETQAAGPEGLCQACRLNRVIPNLSEPGAREAWGRLEAAKRRVIYSLNALGLPIETRTEANGRGLAFDFMKDAGQQKVWTGHSDGLITINIAEADDPFREKMRVNLGEPYRTLLGHFRHEIGHYYWDRLIKDGWFLDRFRALFGDERQDYEAAKQQHYGQAGGSWQADGGWQTRFVSQYASMHPWEDWAETWAHYLHMVDTLETARAFGLSIRPAPVQAPDGAAVVSPRAAARVTVAARRLDLHSFDDLMASWVPLTIALNSLSRSMGVPDTYPFVLSPAAVEKLAFVHEVVELQS
jgi:hypothetical protein